MNVSGFIFVLIWGLLIVVVLALTLPLPRFLRSESIPLGRRRDGAALRDDDRYWYAGLIYYNPEDPDAFVPKRSGFGWTINFGHPMGKVLLSGILLLGLVVPLAIAVLGLLFPGSLQPLGCHPSGCYPWP